MEYKEFAAYVQARAEKYMGEEGKVLLNHVIKNNGVELDGIVMMPEGKDTAPTIYLNSFYEEYMSGTQLDKIMEDIFRIYEVNKDKVMVDSEYFSKYENIKNHVVYKVINYKQNMKLLSTVPYKRILDLAVVFYCLLDELDGGYATAMICDAHIKSWGITVEELYADATRNTPSLLTCNIMKMADVIKSIFEKEELSELQFSKEDEEHCNKVSDDMFIMTNSSKVNGASCILYTDVLEQFAQQMEHDLYILPSSIHEVILLPKKDGICKEELSRMVKEVNETGVSKDEMLSDNVYVYSRQEKSIIL